MVLALQGRVGVAAPLARRGGGRDELDGIRVEDDDGGGGGE